MLFLSVMRILLSRTDYREADLRLCFCICKMLVFSRRGSGCVIAFCKVLLKICPFVKLVIKKTKQFKHMQYTLLIKNDRLSLNSFVLM